MGPPRKTPADDVRSIVTYLNTKPTGATLSEAKAVDKPTVERRSTSHIRWNVAR